MKINTKELFDLWIGKVRPMSKGFFYSSDEKVDTIIESEHYMNNAVYSYNKNGISVISNDIKKLLTFLYEKGIELELDEEARKNFRITENSNGERIYGYWGNALYDFFAINKDIKKYAHWKKLTIKNSVLIKEEYYEDFKPFSVDIKDSLPLIKEWYQKTKAYHNDLFAKNKLLPCLTAGADTRVLSVFWRDLDIKEYYLVAIKPDGLKDKETSLLEVELVSKILKRFNKENITRIENKAGKIVPRGKFTDHTEGLSKDGLNNPKYLGYYIQSSDNMSDLRVFPFLQEQYLAIKNPEPDFMRVLFNLIFCEDVIDIPYVTAAKLKNYIYEEYVPEVFKHARQLIKEWGGMEYVRDYIGIPKNLIK